MKHFSVLLFFFFLFQSLFSQGLDLSGVKFQQYPEGNLHFKNQSILNITPNEEATRELEYEIRIENKIPFIHIDNNSDQWLVLFHYNKTYKYGGMFLYTKESETPQWFWGRESFDFENEYNYSFTATSFLSEGNSQYIPANLSNIDIGKPWVEGVVGYGIGEKIEISAKRPGSSNRYLSQIIISNGYVSYEKPNLYEDNSRIKKIKITDIINTFELVVDVKDTPNLQYIYLPRPTTGIEIEIVEVYEGNKWEDTCVNFIIPVAKDE